VGDDEPLLEVYLNADAGDESPPAEPILQIRVQRLFVGRDPYNWSDEWLPEYEGNSLVVQGTEGWLYFIGEQIFVFDLALGDEVDDDTVHTSMVGNNEVPYPTLITKHNYYLLAEQVVIPRSAIPLGTNPYEVYYDNLPCCPLCDASLPARRRKEFNERYVRYYKYDVIRMRH